jgi:hypothetical protein
MFALQRYLVFCIFFFFIFSVIHSQLFILPVFDNEIFNRSKVDGRIKSLIDVLVGDLEIMTPEKILQGGPRSIRKSVDLLVRLGRENQASQLFLAHRSAYIKHR